MKMDSKRMAEEIEKRLARNDWTFHFDNKKDTLRIEDARSKKGVTVSLPSIIAKWEEKKRRGDSRNRVLHRANAGHDA